MGNLDKAKDISYWSINSVSPSLRKAEEGRSGTLRSQKVREREKPNFWRSISVLSIVSKGDTEEGCTEKTTPKILRYPKDSDALAREETRSLTGSMVSCRPC